ncbi:16S rRNA (cytosine(1407)-C(5))-methyltransferase RsmF [Shewanella maritima]|uniref:16S rRNA (cytosine(1407)-C(5))-methyltransferase RsmF n=1 Tax=Shewanella maritima TaxID=2520507 RepID=UPI003735F23C
MAQINPNFIKHIEQEIPSHLDLDEFLEYCQRPLRQSIRVNTLKISVSDFIEKMRPQGWHFEPIPWCNTGFWLSTETDIQIGNTIEHHQGLFYIQEASSMLPPEALFANNDQTEYVLDVASAPGSKTTQLAAMMQNGGLLVANEYSSSRVKILHANTVRMGVSNVALTHFDGCVFGQYLFETFDSILLDAPCGGEGTIRKDPLALKHWDVTDVKAISETQKQLIESAFLALKPGGTLVYSTCTLSQMENQAICHHLQQAYPDAVEFIPLVDLFLGADKATTAEGFLHVWPQIFDSEGFFIAKIRKITSVERTSKLPKKQKKKQKQFPFTPVAKKDFSQLSKYFSQNFDIELPDPNMIYQRDEELWLFPEQFIPLIGNMRFQRIGVKLADKMKKGYKIKHEALIALSPVPCVHQRSIALSATQAKDFMMGKDIALQSFDENTISTLAEIEHGEMVATYHDVALGMVKHLGHRLKNNLPRDLVKNSIQI